jgi:ribokinase
VIVVDAAGENSIVVVPGANARLDAADVARALGECGSDGSALGDRTRSDRHAGPLVLAQLEVPAAAVEAAARGAGRFVLNASPARKLARDLLHAADPLIVNAGEAAAVTGADGDDPRALAAAAHALGVRSVVITRGAEGALWSTPDGIIEQPAPSVDVLDTTGAGDAFAGTLAVRLSAGADEAAALEAAVRAGAAAVGWRGAQEPR